MKSPALAPLGASLLAVAAALLAGAAAAEPVAERDMPAHCRGMASSEFGVNPRYIESEGVERRKHGFTVKGSYEAADGSRQRFRCGFEANGEFKRVVAVGGGSSGGGSGSGAPTQRQVSACNDMMLGTGQVVETTPLKPGAFELIMEFPDGNFVCDVEADGKVTYFEKLK